MKTPPPSGFPGIIFHACRFSPLAWILVGLIAPLGGCSSESAPPDGEGSGSAQVVIYTALDQIYSEPILEAFENETGIEVRVVYDTEASKTTGLVNRLLAERDRPRCDVFWNNEIARTLHLSREGVIEAWRPPAAEGIPANFRESDGLWTGFAARARVIAWNTDRITAEEAPKSIFELTDPKWKGRVAMAYPLFGTTATHAAVLFSTLGDAEARAYFEALKANDVKIMDGNMTACRAVAAGEIDLCLTDTDDASLVSREGKPLAWTLAGHAPSGSDSPGGALLIPNTLALIRDSPNPEAGKRLIDYLLSADVEARLAASASAQIPLRPGVPAPEGVRSLSAADFLPVDWADAESRLAPSAEFLRKLFAGG